MERRGVAGTFVGHAQLVGDTVGLVGTRGQRAGIGRGGGGVATLTLVSLGEPHHRVGGNSGRTMLRHRAEGGLRRRQILSRKRGHTSVVAHVVGDWRRVERGGLQERSDRSASPPSSITSTARAKSRRAGVMAVPAAGVSQ